MLESTVESPDPEKEEDAEGCPHNPARWAGLLSIAPTELRTRVTLSGR